MKNALTVALTVEKCTTTSTHSCSTVPKAIERTGRTCGKEVYSYCKLLHWYLCSLSKMNLLLRCYRYCNRLQTLCKGALHQIGAQTAYTCGQNIRNRRGHGQGNGSCQGWMEGYYNLVELLRCLTNLQAWKVTIAFHSPAPFSVVVLSSPGLPLPLPSKMHVGEKNKWWH